MGQIPTNASISRSAQSGNLPANESLILSTNDAVTIHLTNINSYQKNLIEINSKWYTRQKQKEANELKCLAAETLKRLITYGLPIEHAYQLVSEWYGANVADLNDINKHKSDTNNTKGNVKKVHSQGWLHHANMQVLSSQQQTKDNDKLKEWQLTIADLIAVLEFDKQDLEKKKFEKSAFFSESKITVKDAKIDALTRLLSVEIDTFEKLKKQAEIEKNNTNVTKGWFSITEEVLNLIIAEKRPTDLTRQITSPIKTLQ